MTFTSDKSFNNAFAKSGSVVTLAFDSNEQLLSSSVSISINSVSRTPSKSSSWDGTKESWVATYTMTDATEDKKSFLKFQNPITKEIITDYDDVGITIRKFYVTGKPPYFWHCVGSMCDRFSFGFRIL